MWKGLKRYFHNFRLDDCHEGIAGRTGAELHRFSHSTAQLQILVPVQLLHCVWEIRREFCTCRNICSITKKKKKNAKKKKKKKEKRNKQKTEETWNALCWKQPQVFTVAKCVLRKVTLKTSRLCQTAQHTYRQFLFSIFKISVCWLLIFSLQLLRFLACKFVFLDVKDLLCAAVLIYHFRVFERKYGSLKFAVSRHLDAWAELKFIWTKSCVLNSCPFHCGAKRAKKSLEHSVAVRLKQEKRSVSQRMHVSNAKSFSTNARL